MNIPTILVLCAVVIALIAAIVVTHKNKKKLFTCGGDCEHCMGKCRKS